MSTEPNAPTSDDDATRQDDAGDEPAKVITAEELAARELAAEQAHAKRLEENLALLRDILDFHGKNLLTLSFTGNPRENAILERLGMAPRHSPDPRVVQKRRTRMYDRVNAARLLLDNVIHAIRTNDHGAWLKVELAFSDFAKQVFEQPQKKIAILTILDIIWEARQELSLRRGFGHLAPGWRDLDTKGSRKKKIPTPTDPESLEHVRTIAAQLRNDLISVDRRFARIEIDRVVELLQENITLERVTGYLVQESSALGYNIKTSKQRDKLIGNFEDWDRERKTEARERYNKHRQKDT